MKKRFLYIFVVCFIAFLLWVLGLVVIFLYYEEATWTTVRVWSAVIFIAACVWSCIHFYRKEKKEREEEENENYKGVY
ncbi:MAG: hypothetical protein IJ060_04615 [Oscillospiraceae bacterium]|nr:hypothetical protein [Oscillospiraceae bacterium]